MQIVNWQIESIQGLPTLKYISQFIWLYLTDSNNMMCLEAVGEGGGVTLSLGLPPSYAQHPFTLLSKGSLSFYMKLLLLEILRIVLVVLLQ